QASAQKRVAGLQHPVVRAVAPALGHLDILGPGARRSERVRAGAAVFQQRRLAGAIAPAKQATLVDRMQRVDKQERASKRKSRRDATVAEARNDVGFRRASRPAWVSHADKSAKKASFTPRLYSHNAPLVDRQEAGIPSRRVAIL